MTTIISSSKIKLHKKISFASFHAEHMYLKGAAWVIGQDAALLTQNLQCLTYTRIDKCCQINQILERIYDLLPRTRDKLLRIASDIWSSRSRASDRRRQWVRSGNDRRNGGYDGSFVDWSRYVGVPYRHRTRRDE